MRMQLKPKEFDAMMQKYTENGVFELKVRDTGDIQYRIYYQGKLIAGTKRSGGAKPMEGLIDKIKNQLNFKSSEFKDLKECPLRSDGILKIYQDRGII